MIDMFAKRLVLSMQVEGLRARDVCARTGFSQSNLSHFTTGQREPSISSLAKLLRAMPNVDARWLVTGKHE